MVVEGWLSGEGENGKGEERPQWQDWYNDTQWEYQVLMKAQWEGTNTGMSGRLVHT